LLTHYAAPGVNSRQVGAVGGGRAAGCVGWKTCGMKERRPLFGESYAVAFAPCGCAPVL